jgi:hypothetical protein
MIQKVMYFFTIGISLLKCIKKVIRIRLPMVIGMAEEGGISINKKAFIHIFLAKESGYLMWIFHSYTSSNTWRKCRLVEIQSPARG